jgi:glycogen synthase
VLITADAVGGVWSHVHALGEALHRPRSSAASRRSADAPAIECTVAVLGPVPPPALDGTWHERVHHFPCRLEWMPAPWDDVRASGAWLRRLARDVRADLVHLNGYAHAALAWEVPVLVGAHSCVCSWWRGVHGVRAPQEWDAYRTHVRRGLHAATAVVAPTAAMLDMLQAEHGTVRRGLVIHNGTPSARRRTAKESLVLSVGRFWDEAKNLHVLDEAARGLSWEVAVVGPTTGPSGAAAPPQHATALGSLPLPMVRHWMQRARIYAHPARYEPFGLAVLEAAQAGCALVLADLPSLREVWGTAAVYVEPTDPAAWHATLQALIDAPARVEALAASARRVARRHSSQEMAEAYTRLYRALAEQSLHPPAMTPADWTLQPGVPS